jgi:two-component system response regulator AtoC
MEISNFNLRPSGVLLPPEQVIFGSTSAMAALREMLHKIADTSIPVLIQGESGTGKEIICRYIHQNSAWAQAPFVKVNCPAIPGTLVESELFGYEKGAFTGALGTKPGRVVEADTGTLFLDEISELDMGLQSKLLQLLQDGQFVPLGSSEEKKVSIRVVCTTSRVLADEAARGRFRQDLYYRIAGVILRLPALRERVADIAMLADYFIAVYNERFNCRAAPLSSSTMLLMKAHPWTGNIRELENLVKRYVVLGTEDAITSELKWTRERSPEPEASLQNPIALGDVTRAAVRDLEDKIILDALQANQWNRKRTARALQISYRSLLYKLKRAGIDGRRATPPQ